MAGPDDPLLAGLVDDAALFPPGSAPMDKGLAEHRVHRGAWYAGLVGPFLCPASRVDELVATLPTDQQLELSIVFDVTGDAAHRALRSAGSDPRVTLVGVEAAQARLGADTETVGGNLARLPGATGFLEVPRTGFDEALDTVARSGWHAAKYRTGGTDAEAFPSEREVAAFLVEVVARGLPFKLTAGLHHAVRHTGQGTGFEHHGLLNVLVATQAARTGSDADQVAGVLAERDPEPLVSATRGWDEQARTGVRRSFRSFGCCGVTDPIDDLAALGLTGGTA
jgi:hypothetical protein